jgi:uncharacterized SAM-binding protein YcdF (DUF218 family)
MTLGRAFRLLRHVMGLLALAAAVGYTVALVLVLIVSQQDERRPAEAIVVLGAAQYNGRPSPVLRARLDHALGLYREGLAPIIVVAGGVGVGDSISEATVGRRYLMAQHVPPEAVRAEAVGRTTRASMDAVAASLRERKIRRVILVSDPFHMFRLRLEARRTALEAYTSPTESSPISENPVLELRFLLAEGAKVPIAWARGLFTS